MKSLSPLSARRGSALVTVMLFSFVLLTLAGSVMQWSITERRLNSRSGYWLEARNAAEAVSEYGCYQVAAAFNARMNPTFTSGGTNPISFPITSNTTTGALFSASAGSGVTLSSVALNAGVVTRVPSTSLYYVDPLDPNNRFDPLIGRYVYRRDVKVLSKATVTPPAGSGGPISAYILETVSVRGAPLFAYAIFYSGNDLEVNPAPEMHIYGPVHVNGNMFVGPVGGNSLNFHGPVSASGNLYHAWRGTTSTAQQGGGTISGTINFATNTDGSSMLPMLVPASGNVTAHWLDSTIGNGTTHGLNNLIPAVTSARSSQFSQEASQRWLGNVQTASMGIQSYNPMGFSEIIGTSGGANVLATDDAADDATIAGTTSLGTGYGHGYGPHALIEPAMALAASGDAYKVAKDAIEEQKFSRKAALYIKVDVNASSDLSTAITIYGDPNSAPVGTPAANIGPNGGLKLGTAPSNVVNYVKYAISSGNVTAGLYDKHHSKGVNLVQLNMGALKTALTNMTGNTTTANTDILKADNVTKWGSGTTSGYDKYNSGSTGWNGGIYVDVTSASTTNHTAVILSNATVTSGQSMVPSVNSVSGLTIATNAPAYILGHFNADGTIGTTGTANSALYPDDYPGTAITASHQVPVAIAADAVTILSPDYFGTGSGTKIAPGAIGTGTTNASTTNAYKSSSTAKPDASGSSEVAAAIISGSNTTSPTSAGTQEYSGGVHNMPRFLESWTGDTVAIRGSLVSMYNCRIATGGWSISYYDPPTRRWGFDQTFANGTYPPCIPTVISYRRVDFTYVANAAAYATQLGSL
jgi:hypothetical protein